MTLDVIFEDNHLLVVNKPAGLLTQPSGTDRDNLEDQAKAWIKEHYQKPGNVYLHAVHRLDSPVSGVVLFARTSKALSRLNASMRQRESKKIYCAMVKGSPPSDEGVLENYLVHDDFHAQLATKNQPESKLARLKYRVLERRGAMTIVEIELETGRYHQIRLQLSTIGCPILGDHRYGSAVTFADGAIALHHSRLTIAHPVTSEMMTFEAPLPTSWATN